MGETHAAVAPKISFICALVKAARMMPNAVVRAIVIAIRRSVLFTWYKISIVRAGSNDARRIAEYLKINLVVQINFESS